MHRPLEPETDNADAGSLSTISALRYYTLRRMINLEMFTMRRTFGVWRGEMS